MSPVLWGTNFPRPDAPTGLASTWDEITSWLTLTWDDYPGVLSDFHEWRVYRQAGAGALERIDDGLLTDSTTPVFVDYDAPLGIPLHYVLTLSNGAVESDGIDVDDEITLEGWYIVVPGDETHSFRIRYVLPDATRAPVVGRTPRWPLGRSGAIVTSGPVRKPSGSFVAQIRQAYSEQVALLREVAEIASTTAWVALKNSRKESFRVQLSSPSETEGPYVLTRMVFTWWAV